MLLLDQLFLQKNRLLAPTATAAVLLLEKVLLRVQSQFAMQSKCVGTFGALVSVAAQVAALVLDQVVGLGKGSVAVGTLVRLLPRVRSQMSLQREKTTKIRLLFSTATTPIAI